MTNFIVTLNGDHKSGLETLRREIRGVDPEADAKPLPLSFTGTHRVDEPIEMIVIVCATDIASRVQDLLQRFKQGPEAIVRAYQTDVTGRDPRFSRPSVRGAQFRV